MRSDEARFSGRSSRSWLPWLLGALLAFVAAVDAQAFWMSTDAGNTAIAAADALAQPETPSAQRTSAGTIGLTFGRAYSSAGRPVTAYSVRRYAPLPATAPSASLSCSWPAGQALACSETGVPDGTWQYTVAAAIEGSLWEGPESPRSNEVLMDTQAPSAPSVPDLAAASDSGASSTDNLTNDSTPMFTGTAEAGSTVKVFAAGVLVGSGVASGGTYSVTVSSLADGMRTITATATDSSGNESATSAALAVTIDTQAPAAPSVPDLAPASDSGMSSTDNITNDTSPTFSGSAEAGATVGLLAGGNQAGSGTATGGSFSVTTGTVGEGAHTITATATDGAGNTSSPSAALVVTIDTTAPLVAATTVAKPVGFLGGAIKQASGHFVYATVADAVGVHSATTDVSTITTGSTSVSLAAGSYSSGGTPYSYRSAQLTATSALTGGTGSRSYSIVSTDVAGNVRTQTGYTVALDNVAPAASNVQTANASGTAGRADAGDSVTFAFSEQIDPHSVLSGWTGTSTGVVVRLIDGGCTLILCSDDTLQVWNAANGSVLPLGTVNLNRSDYIGATVLGLFTQQPITFGASGTPSTMVQSGSAITVTLGTASAAGNTVSTSSTMQWTPSTSVYDAAGNNASGSSVNEGGASDREF